MASNESRKISFNFINNKKFLLGLFAVATVCVLSFAGLAIYIHLNISEINQKSNQIYYPFVQAVAGESSSNDSQKPPLVNDTSVTPQIVESDSSEIKSSSEVPLNTPKTENKTVNQAEVSNPLPPKQVKMRNLTSQDFNDILVDITFENTLDPKIETTITGDTVADRHIYNIAESRGYRFWPQADETKLVEVEPSIRLQPKAKESYQAMAAAAKTEGVILKITSGYRSQTEQNRIFRPRFEALEMAELGGYYKPDDLARGEADDLIYRALALTAPAGYSRHHTGYAVDFADLSPDNTTSVFNGSKAFIWLSKDNYANARKYGFIPSYPAGLQNVGPEPEAWEFVWVGERAL